MTPHAHAAAAAAACVAAAAAAVVGLFNMKKVSTVLCYTHNAGLQVQCVSVCLYFFLVLLGILGGLTFIAAVTHRPFYSTTPSFTNMSVFVDF